MTGAIPPLFVDLLSVINDKIYVICVFNALREGNADKSLARPGRKKANVSVRMSRNLLRRLALQGKQLDDSSRLDVVEVARVPDMLPSLFPSWSG